MALARLFADCIVSETHRRSADATPHPQPARFGLPNRGQLSARPRPGLLPALAVRRPRRAPRRPRILAPGGDRRRERVADPWPRRRHPWLLQRLPASRRPVAGRGVRPGPRGHPLPLSLLVLSTRRLPGQHTDARGGRSRPRPHRTLAGARGRMGGLRVRQPGRRPGAAARPARRPDRRRALPGPVQVRRAAPGAPVPDRRRGQLEDRAGELQRVSALSDRAPGAGLPGPCLSAGRGDRAGTQRRRGQPGRRQEHPGAGPAVAAAPASRRPRGRIRRLLRRHGLSLDVPRRRRHHGTRNRDLPHRTGPVHPGHRIPVPPRRARRSRLRPHLGGRVQRVGHPPGQRRLRTRAAGGQLPLLQPRAAVGQGLLCDRADRALPPRHRGSR